MIPFLFNENRFSFFFFFFVADPLLVGQLCTNPKGDRSLLSFLEVTPCSTSEIADAPQYNSCSLPIQVFSTLKIQIWIPTNNRDVPRVMKTKFPATVMVFGVVSSEGHIMPPHIFEFSLKVNTNVYLDVLKRVYPFLIGPHPPRTEFAGLLRLVIRREHHQHDLLQHQSQPDRRHLPSIRRALAGACGKGMLPVSDPYRGGDWDWRRLQWIDVSSTT